MKNDNFEDILTEALKEYVKDKEIQNLEVPKVEFSKRHEEKMKKLFKAVADGTFEDLYNSEENNEIEHTKVELKNTKSIYIKPIKVAVFVLLGLLVSLAIAPTMSAWRKEELGLYGENKDEYAWILRNDKTEILEAARNNVDEYMEMFGYLPEGFKITKVVKNKLFLYIELKNADNRRIEFKVTPTINDAINMEKIEFEKRILKDFAVMYIEKSEGNTSIWTKEEKEYHLYGDIDWNEMVEIILNVKYEKFEKSF